MSGTDALLPSSSTESGIEVGEDEAVVPGSLDFTVLGRHATGVEGDAEGNREGTLRPDGDEPACAPRDDALRSEPDAERIAPAGDRPDLQQRRPLRSVVPPPNLGPLIDPTPDTMVLHTVDACVLFNGRPGNRVIGSFPVSGGKRFAYAARAFWRLSENDNPYVDWALVRLSEKLSTIQLQLRRAITTRQLAIEAIRRSGRALSVMTARNPATLKLGFNSPYGFAMAELIRQFDYHVRIIRTLVFKDHLSDEEGRVEIDAIASRIRGLFAEPARWRQVLLGTKLRRLRRSDFLPGADDEARGRVCAAVAVFGQLPRNVFTGERLPRHTRRRVKLTGAYLKTLQEAKLGAPQVQSALAEDAAGVAPPGALGTSSDDG